jgi:hypothetical protein
MRPVCGNEVAVKDCDSTGSSVVNKATRNRGAGRFPSRFKTSFPALLDLSVGERFLHGLRDSPILGLRDQALLFQS